MWRYSWKIYVGFQTVPWKKHPKIIWQASKQTLGYYEVIVLFKSFHLNGQTEKLEHLVQHDKQCHMKVLLNSSHLNGHTQRFDLQTQKLEPFCTA